MAYQKMEAWSTPEGLEILRGLARRGLSDEDIAKSIGINKTTLYRWKAKSADISNALRDGKLTADLTVESALFKKATGFTVTDTKTTSFLDKETGELVEGKSEVTTKHILPDTLAIMFWLKNRRPDLWKDKVQEQGDTTETQLNTYLNKLSDVIKSSNPTGTVGNTDTNPDTNTDTNTDTDTDTNPDTKSSTSKGDADADTT